jgi:predicted CopG family antitoxin
VFTLCLNINLITDLTDTLFLYIYSPDIGLLNKVAIVLDTVMFKYCLNINDTLVKTITIKENVFNRLTSQKRKDESFSDLFERLLDNQVTDIEILRKLRGSVEL